MKKYLPLLFSVILVSCYEQKPLTIDPPKNNSTYNVEYLFEHEGCKVYRFFDRGCYVYFTNCNGQTIARTDSSIISRNSTGITRP